MRRPLISQLPSQHAPHGIDESHDTDSTPENNYSRVENRATPGAAVLVVIARFLVVVHFSCSAAPTS